MDFRSFLNGDNEEFQRLQQEHMDRVMREIFGLPPIRIPDAALRLPPTLAAPPMMKFEPAYEPKFDAKVTTGALVAAGYRPFNVDGQRIWAKDEASLPHPGKPISLKGVRMRRSDTVVLDEQDGGSEMVSPVTNN